MSNYEPRTIAFGAEILHPPLQLRADMVQRIHNELFQRPELAYQNFQIAQDGIHLTNLATSPGQISSVTFLPDRMVFREELRGTTIEDFATRVVNAAGVGFRMLGIPQTLGQQYWARSLVAPQHVRDSRTFVAERMLGGGAAALAPFGRPLHSAGIRLSFPSSQPTEPALNLRIEPWVQEPRSLWLEVVGQFGLPLTVERLPEVGAALYTTYRFLSGPALDYVAGFDTP
jgi:hypothetical protein